MLNRRKFLSLSIGAVVFAPAIVNSAVTAASYSPPKYFAKKGYQFISDPYVLLTVGTNDIKPTSLTKAELRQGLLDYADAVHGFDARIGN